MITLSATRADAARLRDARAERDRLDAEITALTDRLRPSLHRYSGVRVSPDHAAYVTADTTRKGWNTAALAVLAQSDPRVAACQTETPVRGSVKFRKPQPTDK